MKLLDCTFRDGGYYNHWDFSAGLAQKYFSAMEQLPVDVVEFGYRSRPQPAYEGRYFYCPEFVLKQARELMPSKELAIMLNEKDCRLQDLDYLLAPCEGLVDTIRMAIAPARFKEALILSEAIKKRGFKVGFNMMYMSTLNQQSPVFDLLPQLSGLVDYFSLVDSYGGVYPEQVKEIVKLCKNQTNVPLGFHGHNNMELAFANSLAAIDAGCEIVDATVCGMGRGAGNLKTELFLIHYINQQGLTANYDVLSQLVDSFNELNKIYEWGTNLPYMVSGANSLPQKDVMDWVTKRYYSINSIIRALHNQKQGEKDNIKLPAFEPNQQYQKAVIVGGGPSVVDDADALLNYLKSNSDTCIIHASSKHARIFSKLANSQFYCLVGNEGNRLESVFSNLENLKGQCILPTYPRKMGTFIPTALQDQSYELKEVTFTEKYTDAHTSLAIQTAIALGVKNLYIAGYDGYPNQMVSGKEQDLIIENNYLFERAVPHFEQLAALTMSRYEIKEQLSIYQLIS